MHNLQAALEIPKRVSLSAQAATSIRKAIDEGLWQESLPSERRLSELFRICRPTVRTALRLLSREGLIQIQQGKRIRLVSSGEKRIRPSKRKVGLIMHGPVTGISQASYHEVTEMRRLLEEQGVAFEIFVCASDSVAVQRRKLEAFIKENGVSCCLLLSVNEKLQRWFVDRSVPALVLGSCHPTVRLPSLDVDHRAVCRHAVGVLLGKGHRRIALIVPNSGVAGDVVSEEGFGEGVKQHARYDEIQAKIVRHNGTATNIAARLDTLFKGDDPPTALVTIKPHHTFAVIVYLASRGIRIPGDVSLIARDFDATYPLTCPAIAHYRFAEEGSLRRLFRLALKLVNEERLPLEPCLIFPKFFKGGSVRPK